MEDCLNSVDGYLTSLQRFDFDPTTDLGDSLEYFDPDGSFSATMLEPPSSAPLGEADSGDVSMDPNDLGGDDLGDTGFKLPGLPSEETVSAFATGTSLLATKAAQNLYGWAANVFGTDDPSLEDDLQNSMVLDEVFRSSSKNLLGNDRSAMMASEQSSRMLAGAYNPNMYVHPVNE